MTIVKLITNTDYGVVGFALVIGILPNLLSSFLMKWLEQRYFSDTAKSTAHTIRWIVGVSTLMCVIWIGVWHFGDSTHSDPDTKPLTVIGQPSKHVGSRQPSTGAGTWFDVSSLHGKTNVIALAYRGKVTPSPFLHALDLPIERHALTPVFLSSGAFQRGLDGSDPFTERAVPQEVTKIIFLQIDAPVRGKVGDMADSIRMQEYVQIAIYDAQKKTSRKFGDFWVSGQGFNEESVDESLNDSWAEHAGLIKQVLLGPA